MSQDFQQPPQKSGGMSVLTIILIVLGVLFLGCAGICGFLGYSGYQAGKKIADEATKALELVPPSLIAETQISMNEEIIAKYGEDVTCGFPSREGDNTGELDTANARFTFSVSSGEGTTPKVNGVAHVHASNTDGLWKILEIKVKCSDGTEIDVPAPTEDQPPELNFDTPEEAPVTE